LLIALYPSLLWQRYCDGAGGEGVDGEGDEDEDNDVDGDGTRPKSSIKKGGRPKISAETKRKILVVYGWARLVKRKMSTIETWKYDDVDLYRWKELLFSGKDAGQIKNLHSPFRE